MNNEHAFLQAIRDNPRDEAARLIYADWLEEHGDVRAEFIRNQCQLMTPPFDGSQRRKLLSRQARLRERIERAWLEQMGYRHWPIDLSGENFQGEILEAQTVAVARYWAPWSGPCRKFSRVVEQIAEEFAGLVVVGNVNVDENGDLAAGYQVSAVPTTDFFVNGRTVERLIGLNPESLIRERTVALLEQARG